MALRSLAAALALVLALAACAGPVGTAAPPEGAAASKPVPRGAAAAKAVASPQPPPALHDDGASALRVVAPTGSIATFVGKVRLVPDIDAATLAANPDAVIDRLGRIVSDNGGGIVANNGARVVANNGARLISDKGGSFVGKVRGGGADFVGKVRYGVRQEPVPAASSELPLVGAEVLVFDADGHQLARADGQPITATTDGQGGYRLAADLPAEPLVLAVRLWNGGELLALAPQGRADVREQAIDTASSLAAGLVLDRYVREDGALLARLPVPAADRLREDLEAARGLTPGAPVYLASALAAQVEALRLRDRDLDQTVREIERLFLGQTNLGDGIEATAVSLGDPTRIVAEPGGGLLIAERLFGRIRRVGPDGRISVFADQALGVVRRSFPWINGMARAADGAVLITAADEPSVLRLAADGTVGAAAEHPGFLPGAITVGPDGTIYAAEAQKSASERSDASRVMAFPRGGPTREVAPAVPSAGGKVLAIARTADGALWTYVWQGSRGAFLMRLAPGGTGWAEVARPEGHGLFADLMADGATDVLATEAGGARISRYSPDGTRTVVLEGHPLVRPAGLARLSDGRLAVADPGAAVVVALDAAGGLPRVIAGVAPGGGPVSADRIALSAPGALALGDDGLYIVDGASNAVRRYADDALSLVAGGTLGFSDDGTPATEAGLSVVTALATSPGTAWFVDRGSKRLRRVGASGLLETAVGRASIRRKFKAVGALRPADEVSVDNAYGLAIDPQGRPIWTTALHHQIRRLEADGQVRLIAGNPDQVAGDAIDGLLGSAAFRAPCGVAFGPDGALYLADTFNFQIRRIVGLDGPAPTIETYAGLPRAETIARAADPASPSGDGGDRLAATFWLPSTLCFDRAGNLYVIEPGTADQAMLAVFLGIGAVNELDGLPVRRSRVRKIAPDGRVSTIAGAGGRHFAAETGADALGSPSGLALDAAGRLAISDATQNLVRFIPEDAR